MSLILTSQEFNYPFASKCSSKTLEKQKKRHRRPPATAHQWLLVVYEMRPFYRFSEVLEEVIADSAFGLINYHFIEIESE